MSSTREKMGNLHRQKYLSQHWPGQPSYMAQLRLFSMILTPFEGPKGMLIIGEENKFGPSRIWAEKRCRKFVFVF